MLRLSRWDETLAGKTQGKTTARGGVTAEAALYLRCEELLKQAALSHLCACVCVLAASRVVPKAQ